MMNYNPEEWRQDYLDICDYYLDMNVICHEIVLEVKEKIQISRTEDLEVWFKVVDDWIDY